MIINRETLKQLSGCDYYDGSLIHSRFAYKFFRDKVTPVGNIISFVAPAKVEAEHMLDLEDVLTNDFIYSESMIHFCFELPMTNLFGGVAFQRLFNSIVGDILAKSIGEQVEVEGDDIFVRKEFVNKGIVQLRGKSSVSIVTECRGAILGHTGINIKAGDEAPAFAYSTNMSGGQVPAFQSKCTEAFYQTAQSIFIATTKVI